jgi:hypothetical protein
MISCIRKHIFFLIIVLVSVIGAKAQEQKKVSLNAMMGLSFLPKSEKIAPSGLPKNIFGGYPWSGIAGIGLNYRLGEKIFLFENLIFLHSAKPSFSFSAGTFKTGLKYNILPLNKKISPFIFGSVDVSLLFLNRKENSRDYFPDSLSNTIGQGYGATKITYNEEKLNLSFVPAIGASAGVGIDFKLSHKVSIFLAYSYNTCLASKSASIKENYFYNKSDFTYGMVNAGLTLHLFRKSKQLLASLNKDAWEGDKTVSVRGTIIYHKNKKSNNNIVPVELTDAKDSTLRLIPSDKEGSFFLKDLARDDYKFMLEKQNKKIKNAELEVIHDHRRIKVADEFQSLEMFDDIESENIISRDGNFSVVLREGFQHEVDLSITGMSITGKLNNVVPDTSCGDIEVLLYDKQDSLIKSQPPKNDCSFHITDVIPGNYKMVFRKHTKEDVSFDYQFTEALPLITRQVNDLAPKSDLDDSANENDKAKDSLSNEVIIASATATKKVAVQKKVKFMDSPEGEEGKQKFLNNNSKDKTNKSTYNKNTVDYSSFKSPGTYSQDGELIQLSGFGVQIGSYKMVSNLTKSIANLKKNGFNDIYIQVISMSIRGRKEKLYRVILGVHKDLNDLREREETLRNSGFQTVFRKHL